jgi:hypothetical protein
MGAMDPAGSLNDGSGEHTRSPEKFEANAPADDVDDRIYGTHFVEMDLFGRKAVDFSFGDGNTMKNGNGFLFDPI